MRNGCDYCFHSEQNAERTRSNFDNQASPWERVGLLRFPFVGVPLELISLQCENFSHKLALQQVLLGTFSFAKVSFCPKEKTFLGEPPLHFSVSNRNLHHPYVRPFLRFFRFPRMTRKQKRAQSFAVSVLTMALDGVIEPRGDRPTTFSLMSLSVTRRRRRRFQVGFHSAGTV